MFKFLSSSFLALVIGFSVANADVVITNFGTSASADGSSGFVYTTGTSVLSGTEGLGDALYTASAFSLDISGETQISLTATATVAPLGNFTITLEDNTAKTVVTSFAWSEFTGGATVAKSFGAGGSVAPGFNYANVVGWSIDSGGSSQALNVTMGNITAVPEPSSVVMLGLGALAGAVVVTRRKARVA